MVKKCIVCNAEAKFKIKDTSDYYCQECAEDNFADISMLLKVEEEAQRLKEFLKEKVNDLAEKEEELDEMVKTAKQASEEDPEEDSEEDSNKKPIRR